MAQIKTQAQRIRELEKNVERLEDAVAVLGRSQFRKYRGGGYSPMAFPPTAMVGIRRRVQERIWRREGA